MKCHPEEEKDLNIKMSTHKRKIKKALVAVNYNPNMPKKPIQTMINSNLSECRLKQGLAAI